jgi:hypothetical protein
LTVPAPGEYLIAARTGNGRLIGSAKILVR